MTNFILHNPKCVFIHLPKTGGTPIQSAFGVEKRFFGHVPEKYRKRLHFTIVRDPKERFLSAVRMFKYGNKLDGDYYSTPRWPDLSISQALDVLEDPWIGYDRSLRKLPWHLKHHTIPQTHPFNCLARADRILRFESLNADFEKLCLELGLSLALPRLGAPNEIDRPEDAMDDLEECRFRELFAQDYQMLGYGPPDNLAGRSHTACAQPDEAKPDQTVFGQWSSYFSDQKFFLETATQALPLGDCALEPFADEVIPGSPEVTWAGRSTELNAHFHNLQPEFAGASRLAHLLACTIVVLRRKPDCEDPVRLFWRILDEQFDVIRSELSLRWLVAVSDTITDFGRDPAERAVGLSASILANSSKLHESELAVFHPKRPWPPKKRVAAEGKLFDGVLAYWTEKGDLIENMFTRTGEVAELTPVAGKILVEITERLRRGPTVYRRFTRIFGKPPVPLLDDESKRRMHRMMKRKL